MDMQEYIKPQGSFLKAEDVKADPNGLWEIMAEGEFVKSDKFNTTRLHLPVKKGEDEKLFDCSKTNARFIALTLKSDDSENWIGKHLELETYRTKTSDGKMVDAINVKQVK